MGHGGIEAKLGLQTLAEVLLGRLTSWAKLGAVGVCKLGLLLGFTSIQHRVWTASVLCAESCIIVGELEKFPIMIMKSNTSNNNKKTKTNPNANDIDNDIDNDSSNGNGNGYGSANGNGNDNYNDNDDENVYESENEIANYNYTSTDPKQHGQK